MRFEYRARDGQGRLRAGILDAEHKNAVVEGLLGQNYYIVSLKERSAHKDISIDLELNRLARVSTPDLAIMTRQLSVMLAAGLSILRSLKILAEQTSNNRLKEAVLIIAGDIESGLALWEALNRHPQIFPRVYVSMIKAGELGGALDAVLNRLCIHLEREQEFNSKLKSASIYPAITSIFAVLVVILIVTFVMPRLAGIFQSSGVALPWPTRLLLGAGSSLKSGGLYIIPGTGVALYFIKRSRTTHGGRLFFDNLLLRLPVLGRTIKQIIIARFASTLGILIKSGIPVLQALEVVAETVGNSVVGEAIAGACRSIKAGDSIAGPLQRSGVFEPMVTDMIAVGEETGALDEMLMQLSDYYERELMHTLDTLITIIEPLLIVLVAILVGGAVIAMLLPMLDMVNLVGI
ncbi:MAG: type II secretion system F family protein [Syntrophomonas sp.]